VRAITALLFNIAAKAGAAALVKSAFGGAFWPIFLCCLVVPSLLGITKR